MSSGGGVRACRGEALKKVIDIIEFTWSKLTYSHVILIMWQSLAGAAAEKASGLLITARAGVSIRAGLRAFAE